MSAPQRSAGGAPHSVYRRRRIVALIAVVAAAIVVVLIVIRPAPPPPAPEPPPAPVAAPTPTSTAPLPCTADQVQITPLTSAPEYPAGTSPELSWSLMNVSPTRCLINIGTSQQILTVRGDEGQVWSSADCRTPADQIYLLEPASSGAQPAVSSPTIWTRVTSAPDACGSPGDQVPSGAYQLSASIGGFNSATAASFVLD
jgi:hypothetical protein